MRLAVVEVGTASCQLLVEDMDDGEPGRIVRVASNRPGLDGYHWDEVLDAVGGLTSFASEIGAERIVAIVTGGRAAEAPAFAERVQRLFTVQTDVVTSAGAAALVAGSKRPDSARRVAVNLGSIEIGLAGAAGACNLPIDLVTLRARLRAKGAWRKTRSFAAAAAQLRAAAKVAVSDVGRRLPSELVATGPGAEGLGPTSIAASHLRRLAWNAPTVETSLAAMAVAELADVWGQSSVTIEPGAVRAEALHRDWRRAGSERALPSRGGGFES